MRQLGPILLLIGLALLLAGCGDHSPPKQGSMDYSKLISNPGENVRYEAIDLEYWLDNTTGKPAMVIISFNVSSSPFGQLIGYNCGFDNGQCKYFRIWSGKGKKKDIPFIENDLISTGKVPVYYAVKKDEMSKTTLTFGEFARLQAAIENEDYTKAKQIVTENEKEPLSI